MPRIHLIEKNDRIRPVNTFHESGYWILPQETAQALVGGDIYFHKKRNEPSFYGGKITGWRIHEDNDQFKNRIIFIFEFSQAHKNVLAEKGGWSYDRKIVW